MAAPTLRRSTRRSSAKTSSMKEPSDNESEFTEGEESEAEKEEEDYEPPEEDEARATEGEEPEGESNSISRTLNRNNNDDKSAKHMKKGQRKRSRGNLDTEEVRTSEKEREVDEDDKERASSDSGKSLEKTSRDRKGQKRSRSKSKNKKEDSDSECSLGSEIDDKKTMRKKRGQAKRKKKLISNEDDVRDRTCPHCKKVISSKAGLKYHIDHSVCLKAEKVNKAAPKKAGKTKAKKERGSRASRTCPHCKRVFTSIFGRNYHVKHLVCKQKPADSVGDLILPTLEPGARFATMFGLVEVIKDDRGESTATYKPNHKAEVIRYIRSVERLATSNKQLTTQRTINSILKRKALSEEYARHRLVGGSPRTYDFIEYPAHPSAKTDLKEDENPAEPKQSMPDRIVVCKLIPDTRERIIGSGKAREDRTRDDSSIAFPRTKLYLQRKLLVKRYAPKNPVYQCALCGKVFDTAPGLAYHSKQSTCKKRRERLLAQKKERKTVIEKSVEAARRGERLALEKRSSQGQRVAVYSQVWQCLRFKWASEKPVQQTKEDEGKDADDEISVNPEQQILELRLALERERIDRSRDLHMESERRRGAVYPSVMAALKFRKPRRTRRRRIVAPDSGSSRKKAKQTETSTIPSEQTEAPSTAPENPTNADLPAKNDAPPVPIIDTHVLVLEIDKGRYPSIKRYDGEHNRRCEGCKRSDGTLINCNFCRRAVHQSCMDERVLPKDPEPEEDFICYYCIRYILARRRRAEKRRIQKLQKAGASTKAATTTAKTSTAAAIVPVKVEETYESDFHKVAALGRDLHELLELLGDARHRLFMLTETKRINDVRRSMMVAESAPAFVAPEMSHNIESAEEDE